MNVTTIDSPNITVERKQVHLTYIIMPGRIVRVYDSNVINLEIL